MPTLCLSTDAVGDMLDGAPAGQREAARRALQAKGIQLVPDALVTSVQRVGPPTDPGAHASDPGAHGGDGDIGRRRVHLKVGGPGPEARAHGCMRCMVPAFELWRSVLGHGAACGCEAGHTLRISNCH